MLQRCHNPKHQAFAKYGGEGIKVCARWRKSFDAFFADMGERPSRAHSIDRRDNEKGYFKENCRWATALEQQINRRCTVYVEWRGAQVRLKALCDQLGLKYGDVAGRYRRGWPIETAVSKPFKRYGPRRRLDPAERKALITARHSRKKAREARKAANAALRAKLVMSTKPSAGIPKRSVIVAGHRTSISVEGPFWAAIMGAAAARQISINDLISEISLWAEGQPDAANLSSAVRL
ncbi:MAG TPA: ribbon-helix-helix domain-containing protein, partial [Sphingomicrobium sp.]|nr:ribbon-helix-helix domain-containing protein [Sphingomicrobium sp.]